MPITLAQLDPPVPPAAPKPDPGKANATPSSPTTVTVSTPTLVASKRTSPSLNKEGIELSLDAKDPTRLATQPGVEVTIFNNLGHGKRSATNAIVLHMTGGTAAGTLSNYKNTTVGAHFLISKDGTITQTAGLDQVAYHVGKIRPKGYQPTAAGGNQAQADNLDAYSKAVLARVEKKEISFAAGVKLLSDHEAQKPYGNDPNDATTRLPMNGDSIGIEFEAQLGKDGKYEALTAKQVAAGAALVTLLETTYGLTADDVYAHPDVSYKDYSEARNAKSDILALQP
jgi:N-acetylmuramoyl-L-alanine amidase